MCCVSDNRPLTHRLHRCLEDNSDAVELSQRQRAVVARRRSRRSDGQRPVPGPIVSRAVRESERALVASWRGDPKGPGERETWPRRVEGSCSPRSSSDSPSVATADARASFGHLQPYRDREVRSRCRRGSPFVSARCRGPARSLRGRPRICPSAVRISASLTLFIATRVLSLAEQLDEEPDCAGHERLRLDIPVECVQHEGDVRRPKQRPRNETSRGPPP